LRGVPCHPVDFVTMRGAQVTLQDSEAAGKGFTSTVSAASARATKVPAALINRFADWFCRKKQWQLIAATFCGALAIWVHASSDVSEWLFGNDWSQSWVWWLVAVPLDVSLLIFFTRYLASFVFRIWLRDISESPVIRETFAKVCSGMIEDTQFKSTVANLLADDDVARGVSGLISGVMNNPGVQQAIALSLAGIVTSKTTADAVLQCTSGALRHENVRAEAERFLSSQEVGRALTLNFARVLEDDAVREASAGAVLSILRDDQVGGVLHQQAMSFLQDGKLYQAGGQGFKSAMFPSKYGNNSSSQHEI